ncbi:MAG: hypothetical protein ACRBCK_08340 [Alphaproteobacteria bacterium]
MGKYFLRFVLLSSPLLLSACGEGWEAKRIDNVEPYQGRTAGTGVAYVRAKMMPEKELKLEPVAVKEEVEPVLDAEEIFNEAQGKGKAAEKETPKMPENDVKAEEILEEKHSNIDDFETGIMEEDVIQSASIETSADIKIPEISAEQFIEQAPKSVDIPQLEVKEIETARVDDEHVEHVVEIYENTVAEPEKELMTPKKDFFDLKSVGQENLDDIYSDPF